MQKKKSLRKKRTNAGRKRTRKHTLTPARKDDIAAKFGEGEGPVGGERGKAI